MQPSALRLGSLSARRPTECLTNRSTYFQVCPDSDVVRRPQGGIGCGGRIEADSAGDYRPWPGYPNVIDTPGQGVSLEGGSGPFPAVVIAFHVGGLDDFDRAMADRLAAEGYVAVVPDLFHRLTEEQMNGPRLDRLGYLSDPDIIADCNAPVSFLPGNSAAASNSTGVT